EIGAAPGGQNVFEQVGQVDALPDIAAEGAGLFLAHFREFAEERGGITEGGIAQAEEAGDIPIAQILDIGIDIDREIDEVRGEEDGRTIPGQVAGLQDIEAFHDEDVGAVDDDLLAGHYVIDQVRIDRHGDVTLARFDISEEIDEA